MKLQILKLLIFLIIFKFSNAKNINFQNSDNKNDNQIYSANVKQTIGKYSEPLKSFHKAEILDEDGEEIEASHFYSASNLDHIQRKFYWLDYRFDHVTLVCNASFPVQWFEGYGKNDDDELDTQITSKQLSDPLEVNSAIFTLEFDELNDEKFNSKYYYAIYTCKGKKEHKLAKITIKIFIEKAKLPPGSEEAEEEEEHENEDENERK